MTVRKILSARAARPQIEGMLEALVKAAVFIGQANGSFSEEELDVFIDSMREVVSSAMGEEFVATMASTTRLLDQARAARRELRAQGDVLFLKQLAPQFPGDFARDGLVLAYRIVLADGQVTDAEAGAFEALATALGVEVGETLVLRDLATKSEQASHQGHRGSSLEALETLAAKGWQKLEPDGFDAGVRFDQPDGGKLSLELEASESVLHVHVHGADGKGPHLVCLFGDALPGLLVVLDAMRLTLTPTALGEKLPAVRAVCPEVFVEHEGRFGKL